MRAASALKQLDFQADLDLVPDQHAASLERLVPAQAEILAVDLAGGLEAAAGAAPGIFGDGGGCFDRERDWLGHAMDGEIAGHAVAIAVRADLRGAEGQGRVLLGVEEVGAAQVRIALRLASVEARGLD